MGKYKKCRLNIELKIFWSPQTVLENFDFWSLDPLKNDFKCELEVLVFFSSVNQNNVISTKKHQFTMVTQ